MKKQSLFPLGILAGMVGAVTAYTYAQYRRESTQATRFLADGKKTIQTKSGLQEYEVVGDGLPLLISHGSGGGYDQGVTMAKLLNIPCRVIAPSRFGYLGMPLPKDASPNAKAKAYADLLDALGIHQQTVIAGISAGGHLASRSRSNTRNDVWP